MQASVRVMRSHDYCHFEVSLSADDLEDLKAVDDLRKAAARLADKAVAQYQLREIADDQFDRAQRALMSYNDKADDIKSTIPEADRSPEHNAIIAYVDALEVLINSKTYDYEDNFVVAPLPYLDDGIPF